MVKKVDAGVRSCWMLVGWDHGSFSPQRAAAIWVTLLATSTPCTQSYKIHTKRTPSASRLLQHIPKALENTCISNVGLLWGWHPRLVSVLGQLSKPVRATSISNSWSKTSNCSYLMRGDTGKQFEISKNSAWRNTSFPHNSCYYQQCLPQIETPSPSKFGQNTPWHYYPISWGFSDIISGLVEA